MTLVSETSHKQNPGGNHKVALNEKPTDSPQWFFIRNSVFNLIGWDKNKMKQLRNILLWKTYKTELHVLWCLSLTEILKATCATAPNWEIAYRGDVAATCRFNNKIQ